MNRDPLAPDAARYLCGHRLIALKSAPWRPLADDDFRVVGIERISRQG